MPEPEIAATAEITLWWQRQEPPEPVVIERVQWAIYDPETDGYLFTGDGPDAERWMQRLSSSRPTALLVCERVRTVSQTWIGDREVVPWTSPCDWIAAADESGRQIGRAWCSRHRHNEGEPVPAEHVRGGDSVAG